MLNFKADNYAGLMQKNYFDCPVNVELINGVSVDHSNYLSGFSTDYFYVKAFALSHSASLFFVM